MNVCDEEDFNGGEDCCIVSFSRCSSGEYGSLGALSMASWALVVLVLVLTSLLVESLASLSEIADPPLPIFAREIWNASGLKNPPL